MALRKHKGRHGRTSYYVYVKDGDGRWRYVGKAATKEDGKALERREREINWQVRHGLRPPDLEETFAELALPWVEKRLETHRRGRDDVWRMRKHLVPYFGKMRVAEIDVACVRGFIERARQRHVGAATIYQGMRLLGRFLSELVLDGKLAQNAVARLDRATRRLFKPTHDPRQTPFLHQKEEIRAVYLALPDEERVMFALGVFAGLRLGEILGLRIEDVDLRSRRILVQRSYGNRPKDDDPRIVPVTDALLPVLRAWLVRLDRKEGLVFVPTGHGAFVKPHRVRERFHAAIEAAGVARLTWYQATRHTFASHWIMDGRPIEKLRDILGHSTVQVTERYAHLAPEAFGREDYRAVFVDLGELKVLPFPGTVGHKEGIMALDGSRNGLQVVEKIDGEMAERSKAPDSKDDK